MGEVDQPLPLLGHRQWAEQHVDRPSLSGLKQLFYRRHLHKGCLGADPASQFIPEID